MVGERRNQTKAILFSSPASDIITQDCVDQVVMYRHFSLVSKFGMLAGLCNVSYTWVPYLHWLGNLRAVTVQW